MWFVVLACVSGASAIFTPTAISLNLQFSLYSPQQPFFSGHAILNMSLQPGNGAEEDMVLDAEQLEVTNVKIEDSSGTGVPVIKQTLVNNQLRVTTEVRPGNAWYLLFVDYVARVYPEGEQGVFATQSGLAVGTNFFPRGARRAFPCVLDPRLRGQVILSVTPSSQLSTPVYTSYRESAAAREVGFWLVNMERVEWASRSRVTVWAPTSLHQAVASTQGFLSALYHPFFTGLNPDLNVILVPGLRPSPLVSYGVIALRWDLVGGGSGGVEEKVSTVLSLLEGLGSHLSRAVLSPAPQHHWLGFSLPIYLQYLSSSILGNYSSLWSHEVRRKAFEDTKIPIIPSEDTDLLSDAILPSVYKGVSVLKMLESVSSEDALQKDLTTFYKKFADTTVTTEDMLSVLGSGSLAGRLPPGRSLSVLLSEWLYNLTYPLLDLTTSSASVSLTQEPFSSEYKNLKWNMPVSLYGPSVNSIFWMLDESVTIQDSRLYIPSWIEANNLAKGAYRMRYSDAEWGYVTAQGFSEVKGCERAQLLDDSFSLWWNGKEGPRPLSLLDQLSHFTDYQTIVSSIGILDNLRNLFYDSHIRNPLEMKMAAVMFELYYKVVPWTSTPDSVEQRLAQREVIRTACSWHSATCELDAAAAFTQPISPDLYYLALCAKLKDASQTEWDSKFQSNYLATKDLKSRAYKRDMFYAFACPTLNTTIDHYLTKLLTDSRIDESDALLAFSSLFSKYQNFDQVLKFTVEFSSQLIAKYGQQFLVNLIKEFTPLLFREDQLKTVDRLVPGAQELVAEAAQTAHKTLQDKLKLRDDLTQEMEVWLGLPTSRPPTTHFPASGSLPSLSFVVFFVTILLAIRL